MKQFPWITLLTLLPIFGGIVVSGISRAQLARRWALFFSLLALGLGITLWAGFDSSDPDVQFVERYEWIPSIGAEYFVGVDGLGLLMVLLSAAIVPFALMAPGRISENTKMYFGLFLFLEAGLFGTFTALNFIHWFLYWELSLVPAYFLIKLWGGGDRAGAAAQFFVYTLVGSVTLLLAFLAIFLSTRTMDFIKLAELARGHNDGLASYFSVSLKWYSILPQDLALIIFFGAFLGFAVKVPVVPFHTWLPATYAAAPTGVVMVLTGVMSKMGVYGFLRILLPIFGEQMRQVLTPLLWLSLATILFSAFAAFAQRDLKRLLAYSSINHLGYCLLGIMAAVKLTGQEANWAVERAAVLNGVLLQMVNHGVTAAALFWFVGWLEERGGGYRGLNDFGGLRQSAPVFTGLMGIAIFASLGLPGLNGFIGEFLIFKGAFALVTWATALATIGLLVTAVFLLTMVQRVFWGPLPVRWSSFRDLTVQEGLIVIPGLLVMLLIGIYPAIVLKWINATVTQMAAQLAS
ncbi:MAG TPA: NADH-quinone oxidoreductase subunit M [Candidatus Saccharimonadales bacterium]|nr:NADH-quinone oxidoreductase subunit M [Candidatus Saccharimonadales bacterium]